MTESQRVLLIYQKQHKLYAKRIRPLFLSAIRKQIKPVIDWMETFQTLNPPLDALVPSDVFRVPYKQAFDMVGITAAKREYYYMQGNDSKGVLDFLVNKWRILFNSYALDYAYRIENELTETTKQSIRDALQKAYDEGLNADRAITLIKKYALGQISRFRATLISRTETTTISNYAKEVGARDWLAEQGQKGYKQWIGRNDGHERRSHILLNDMIIPIDDKFNVGGIPADRPGDLNLSAKERIQCRCTLIYMSERRYNRMKK